MQIITGLFDHMVLQRNLRNVSEARIEGKCVGSGAVIAKVSSNGKTVRGFSAARVGTAGKGKFVATLKGLPVGGPYDVILSIASSQEMDGAVDVLVGDVWIMAGQSNMEGNGRSVQRVKADAGVRAFYMDDRWAVAVDPLHNRDASVDEVHALHGGRGGKKPEGWGIGPGVSFGQAMHKSSGVPQGLIACAHGGTRMNQWDPALKKEGTRSLYGATLRRFRKNGSKVAGVLWYQGCSDTVTDDAKVYTKRMKALVAASRRDMGDAKLPWAIVQIARAISGASPAPWNSVQDQQRRLTGEIRNVTVVPTIDLPLDDHVHLSGPAQRRLGKRLADAVWALCGGKGVQKPPIELGGFEIKPDAFTSKANVIVTFKNVVGRLKAAGEPAGFEVADANGAPCVFRTDLDGHRAILHTFVQKAQMDDKKLHYGMGTMPICNITDEADRSLPVFGPLLLGTPTRALSPFIMDWQVSKPADIAGDFAKLRLADMNGSTVARKFGPFCNVRDVIEAQGQRECVIYFRTSIDCPENMKLNLLFGYDGPAKLWYDGKEAFCDPNGTNPAVIDHRRISVSGSKGRHEIVVALASNQGRAFGIFVRAERKGVPVSVLKKGPNAYAMPAVVQ